MQTATANTPGRCLLGGQILHWCKAAIMRMVSFNLQGNTHPLLYHTQPGAAFKSAATARVKISRNGTYRFRTPGPALVLEEG